MSESVNNSITPTSQVDRLPIELIRHIFKFATVNDHSHRSSLNTSLCPWILTGICRRWRSISIGAPDLWTDIRLAVDVAVTPPPSRYEREPWKIEMEMIQLQLERSQPMPFDVYLYSDDWEMFPYLDTVAVELREHHQRWKSFILWDTRGTGDKLLEIFPLLGQRIMPQLERLDTDLHSRAFSNEDFFRLSCPKLRHVTFGLKYPFPSAIPWRQIEELTLRNIHNRQTTLPYADLGNLRKLTLKNTTFAELSGTFDEGRAILPCLEIMDISDTNVEAFHLITAPTLHTVNFQRVRSSTSPGTGTPKLKQLVHRSKCTIVSLLIKPVLDIACLLELLMETPALKHLELQLSSGAAIEQTAVIYARSELFASKMRELFSEESCDRQFKYCPRLVKLVLDGVGGIKPKNRKTNLDEILAVAEERQRIVADEEEEGDGTLEELVLNQVRPHAIPYNDCDFVERVELLRKFGMTVVVNTC